MRSMCSGLGGLGAVVFVVLGVEDAREGGWKVGGGCKWDVSESIIL